MLRTNIVAALRPQYSAGVALCHYFPCGKKGVLGHRILSREIAQYFAYKGVHYAYT